ncbi:hypothetical protein G6F68_015761 [Rhizopus microsporus]|nr:hypothetical protein G6F68_015761 [Rhizopus microsporus]
MLLKGLDVFTDDPFTHIAIVIVPRRPAGHVSLVVLDDALVWIKVAIGFPDTCQGIMALGGKDTQEINPLVLFNLFAQHVLVNTKLVLIQVADEISIAMFFGDGSKEGNHVPSVSEMGETARVNESLFSRVFKDIIITMEESISFFISLRSFTLEG